MKKRNFSVFFFLFFFLLGFRFGTINLARDAGRKALEEKHSNRVDVYTPEVMTNDWSAPIRIGSPINTASPEDAIEISHDGSVLYFLRTRDVLQNMSPDEMLSFPNGTYSAKRTGGPGDFDTPLFYDLGKGIDKSLDGEISFSTDNTKVYFHSNRATNTGYQHGFNDPLDIYVADIIDGEPGPGINLGSPINSDYLDGEHAIYPSGNMLCFSSTRPGGYGGADIYYSALSSSGWSDPVNLGPPISSSAADMQPTFTADGNTIYFTSDRDGGMAIYRSIWTGSSWGTPELVIKGLVGEPAITADGKILYFVHVLVDSIGIFDADVWYTEKK